MKLLYQKVVINKESNFETFIKTVTDEYNKLSLENKYNNLELIYSQDFSKAIILCYYNNVIPNCHSGKKIKNSYRDMLYESDRKI